MTSSKRLSTLFFIVAYRACDVTESTHWFVNILEIHDHYESQLKTISHSICSVYCRQNIHQIYRWRSNLSMKTTKMLLLWQLVAASWSFSGKYRSQEAVDVIGIIPNACHVWTVNVRECSNLTTTNSIAPFTTFTYAVLSRITWTLS